MTSKESKIIVVGVTAVVLLGLTIGCGQRGPRVEFVEGVVVHDGQPVVGATVGFSPVDGSAGLPANGVTNATGTFHLTAARGGGRSKGTAVGEYVVIVSKSRGRMPDLPMPADGSPQLERWNAEALRLAALPPIHELPAEYAEVATSPLRVTVKPGRNTGPSMRFELEGKADRPEK
jgi:hypothetical protein